MRAPKFTSGKYAWGMCDICGIRCKLHELKMEFVRGKKKGTLACPTCWDPDHPQNFLDKFVTTDPQALRNPRPDTGLAASRRMFPPMNWVNGQPPTIEQQEAMLTNQMIKQSDEKILADWENRRFWEANQRVQGVRKP